MSTPEESKTRKRKRVNKNKKKNWRKHVDITDVEEYLEDTRLEERTGGPAAGKQDSELFILDTSTSQAAPEPVPVKKSRREVGKLKCFANLEPDPRIKPARIKHGIRQHSLEKRCRQIQERIKSGTLTHSQKQSLKDAKTADLKKQDQVQTRQSLRKATFDLWGSEESFLDPEDFTPKTISKKKKKLPSHHGKKPTSLPSVEVAHPGASYNPTFDDHQELLSLALEVEVEKEKKENKILRRLDTKFPTRAGDQHTWLTEMSSGLFDEEDGRESEAEGDLDQISYNPPVRREDKKTDRQRRKELQRKTKVQTKVDQKESNMKQKEFHRIRSIKKQVKSIEEKHSETQTVREARRVATKDRTRKLGKQKFEAPLLEIKLSSEMEGSLRLLKAEGNLIEDRFKSLQKRNIIEPRNRANFKRRYKIKTYEKRGHREITL